MKPVSLVSDSAVGETRPQPRMPKVDDTNLTTTYANFCRVLGTPEELIVDLGLNTHPSGGPNASVPVTQRVVLNYFTAKRLLQAIGATISRHESTFGPIETSISKRAEHSS